MLRTQGALVDMSAATPVYHADFEADTREAALHDPHVLPHHYSSSDVEAVFPRAEVPPDDADTFADVDVAVSGRYSGIPAIP